MCQDIAIRAAKALWLAGALALYTPSAYAETEPVPCAASAQSRGMDFWLGTWTVTYPGAPAVSHSKVSLDLDKCLLVESWDGGKGHSGKNMLAYSADDENWHGMFADNQGRVHVFAGKVTAGSAEFLGTSRSASGQAVLNRIKVVRVSPDEVAQTWEKSTDNGATWTIAFGGKYSRQSPK